MTAAIAPLKGWQQVALDGDSELALSPGTSSLPTKKRNLLRINWIGQRLTRQVAPWMRREVATHLRAACKSEPFWSGLQACCGAAATHNSRIEIQNQWDVRDGSGSAAALFMGRVSKWQPSEIRDGSAAQRVMNVLCITESPWPWRQRQQIDAERSRNV